MTSYFSGFVDFVGTHPHYALTAVFLLALSEAIPVIGTVVGRGIGRRWGNTLLLEPAPFTSQAQTP
jgi:hypothetical protein